MSNFFLRGDHLSVHRGLYSHHGIALGDGRVIHYSGEVGRKRDASIRVDPIEAFAAGGTVELVAYGACHDRDTVVARAWSRLGEDGYDLFGNNCEHFARWCKTGAARSGQVERGIGGASAVGGTAAGTAGALGVVSAAGAVAGLGGSGVMSGLAAAGSVVGGGAVAGLAVLAVAPAAVGVAASHALWADDAALPEAERSARAAGRTASAVGALAGTAGSVAAVSAAGTVAGLSGAGIASGLAAIGGTVGGGMAAGVVLTVAAPAAAAVAIGAAVYTLGGWLFGDD